MRTALIAALVAVIGLGSYAYVHRHASSSSKPTLTPLIIYCAAGIKNPAEVIAGQYEKEFGVSANLNFGGTATLLSQLRIAKTGDLFIAADDAAISEARDFGLIRDVLPLVRQTPVVAVAKGNPKHIGRLDDLLRPGVRFGLANPEGASIGRVTKRVLGTRWNEFSGKATVFKPTVMDIATDVKIGTVDAAVVWDSTASQFPELQAIAVTEFSQSPENASVAVLAGSAQPAAAFRFAHYLTAPEKGGRVFKSQGFKTVPGDPWTDNPVSGLSKEPK